MKIILANTAGFCFGVKRAVDLAFHEGNQEGVYTFGPIIHNDEVVAQLKEVGISPTEDITDLKANTLIIRSHGTSPTIYEKAQQEAIKIVDATCPYVKKIHKLVADYSGKGYHILLVGNHNHPEIQGISGWVKGPCTIVKDKEELEAITLDRKVTYLVVSQTTYKKEVVEEIIAYLEANEYVFEYINTICNATKERQEEAVMIAKQVDTMIVVGSTYSSNTQKLYELCKKHCENTVCVASASELLDTTFKESKVIGITAGASTPDTAIHAVLAFVKGLEVI